MGSSILGTKLSLMVAYASRAPSGDHQWATWERKISSVRVSTRMRIRSKSVISHQHITAAEPPLGSSVRCWKQWPHFIGRVEPFVNVPSQFWLQKKKKRHQHKYFKNVSKNIPLVFTASCLTWFYFSVQAQSNCRLSVLSFCSTHTYTHAQQWTQRPLIITDYSERISWNQTRVWLQTCLLSRYRHRATFK